MDRIISLKKTDSNSLLSNTSISSELGYETAQDDSISSLYYSINDDTLTESPNLSDHDAEPTTVLDHVFQSHPIGGPSTATSVGTNSLKEISIGQVTSTDNPQPIYSSGPDDIAERSMVAVPAIPLMQSIHYGLDAKDMDAVAAAQNIISTLPPPNNIAGSSRIVQELYVVAVSQRQTHRAPELGRAARRATVRFQDNPPRRHESVVRREVSRRSEMPRRSVLPLARRTQAEPNINARSMPLGTLTDNNAGAKAESHVCDICKKSFPLRSTLNVHKSSHKIDCKYCDRKFQKPLALSIHLKENCQKIPSAIRRKILTKEFKNVSSRM
ncbi:uncharacterized protein LOC119069401 [Bradysia coprophila]|uniref:uncharacterized protein LOC119069401 n=1 Tax=Bradysia coprophila TaxID=38358 RepID=UPI00187D7167|nr:uncharacterized protein LOC119069401 [Bradysia coprophila]